MRSPRDAFALVARRVARFLDVQRLTPLESFLSELDLMILAEHPHGGDRPPQTGLDGASESGAEF